ncbi:MAG: tetratricopeptide repeat protein [Firmicutes bacterium]|nr:tetratricopeptide repeat protein [Bacillota bacterium]
MEAPSTRGTSILKIIILTGLCGLLVVLAIQIDLPTLQNLADRVQLKIVEHQLENGAFSQEELLKEGWLYYNLGQYEKARQYMEQAAAGDTNISAFYCLGLIDMKYRQYENAITKFKIVAAKSPKHAATRIALGQAYYQLRYWGQAAREFEHVVQLEPTDEAARLWLGKTYISLNQPEKAKVVLETVTHGRESMEAAALLKNLQL